MRVWSIISEALECEGACVLVSIADGAGSTPREAGARMVVRPDGSLAGTIGGGHLEFQAHRLAMEFLKDKPQRRFIKRRFSLGPDLGQCCGGRADVSFEVLLTEQEDQARELAGVEAQGKAFRTVFPLLGDVPGQRCLVSGGDAPGGEIGPLVEEAFGEERQKLYLFGAGHVGRAVVLALAPLPFEIIWIDTRREAFPQHMPAQVQPVLSADPARELVHAEPGSFVLVMTHDHALDEEIVASALYISNFTYIGLIGSETKKKRFTKRLMARGLGPEALSGLTCPIGTGRLSSKLPAAIAADVTLQLLERLESLEISQKQTPEGGPALEKVAGFGR